MKFLSKRTPILKNICERVLLPFWKVFSKNFFDGNFFQINAWQMELLMKQKRSLAVCERLLKSVKIEQKCFLSQNTGWGEKIIDGLNHRCFISWKLATNEQLNKTPTVSRNAIDPRFITNSAKIKQHVQTNNYKIPGINCAR